MVIIHLGVAIGVVAILCDQPLCLVLTIGVIMNLGVEIGVAVLVAILPDGILNCKSLCAPGVVLKAELGTGCRGLLAGFFLAFSSIRRRRASAAAHQGSPMPTFMSNCLWT